MPLIINLLDTNFKILVYEAYFSGIGVKDHPILFLHSNLSAHTVCIFIVGTQDYQWLYLESSYQKVDM